MLSSYMRKIRKYYAEEYNPYITPLEEAAPVLNSCCVHTNGGRLSGSNNQVDFPIARSASLIDLIWTLADFLLWL
jgi:hypothetical protein